MSHSLGMQELSLAGAEPVSWREFVLEPGTPENPDGVVVFGPMTQSDEDALRKAHAEYRAAEKGPQ